MPDRDLARFRIERTTGWWRERDTAEKQVVESEPTGVDQREARQRGDGLRQAGDAVRRVGLGERIVGFRPGEGAGVHQPVAGSDRDGRRAGPRRPHVVLHGEIDRRESWHGRAGDGQLAALEPVPAGEDSSEAVAVGHRSRLDCDRDETLAHALVERRLVAGTVHPMVRPIRADVVLSEDGVIAGWPDVDERRARVLVDLGVEPCLVRREVLGTGHRPQQALRVPGGDQVVAKVRRVAVAADARREPVLLLGLRQPELECRRVAGVAATQSESGQRCRSSGLLHDAQERRVARGAGGREDRRRIARRGALVEERLEARGVGAVDAGERGARSLGEHRCVQGTRSRAIDAGRDRSETTWDEPVPGRLIVAEGTVVDGLPRIDHAPPPTSHGRRLRRTEGVAHPGPPRCRPPPGPPFPMTAPSSSRRESSARTREPTLVPVRPLSVPRGVASSSERWQSGRMHPP